MSDSKYDALFAAKKRLILLALREAEGHFTNETENPEQTAAEDAISEEFDQAALAYTKELFNLAVRNIEERGK